MKLAGETPQILEKLRGINQVLKRSEFIDLLKVKKLVFGDVLSKKMGTCWQRMLLKQEVKLSMGRKLEFFKIYFLIIIIFWEITAI